MRRLKVYFVGSLPNNPTAGILEVSSEVGYLEAIQRLEDSEFNNVEEIWVRNQYQFSWLHAYAEHTGLTETLDIVFSRVTARDILSERWKLSLPEWLTDEKIVEENLLDESLLKNTRNVPTALLTKTIPFPEKLLTEHFPESHAGLLLEKINEPKVADRLQSGLDSMAWSAVCNEWRTTSTGKWKNEFVDRLEKDSKRLWSDLTVWSILAGYPEELKGFALDPGTIAFLRQVPTESYKGMKLCPKGVDLALDQLSHYLNEILSGGPSTDEVDKVLGQMSGRLEQEFVFAERLLESVPNAVTAERIERVQTLFVKTATQESLAKLRSAIRPPEPKEVDETVGPREWLKWATEEYFPYRRWQIQQQSFDPVLEQTIAHFSRWYTENYATVHADPDLSAIQGISQWKDLILADDFSLILIVDNLPFFFVRAFDHAMRSAGFFLHDQKPRYVPLPSKTDVSKPMLLAGGKTNLTDYKSILKQRSQEEWNNRDTAYFGSIGDLKSTAQANYSRVAVLNYLAADDFLHKDSTKSGVTEEEQLSLLFKGLATGTFDVCRQISNTGKKVGVYVMTDHGSTRLLKEESRAVDSKLSEKLFSNQKCRSATMSPEQAETLPANLWSLGIRFECPVHSDQVHFIPSGHNTVASTRKEDGYFHGGATPEEVIAPFSLYRLVQPERPELGLRIIESAGPNGVFKWYIKRVVTLTLELQNRSRSNCVISKVEMSPEVGEVRHFEPAEVLGGKSARSTVSFYFQQAAIQVSEITISVEVRYANESEKTSISIPVDISSAMSGGLDLKKL
jgi:hypothetical protein